MIYRGNVTNICEAVSYKCFHCPVPRKLCCRNDENTVIDIVEEPGKIIVNWFVEDDKCQEEESSEHGNKQSI